MGETISIGSDRLTAEIGAHGAELRRLRDEAGRDLQWDGDPAFWTGRAPILFPVIGCTAGGVIRVDGSTYNMPKHGFARDRTFAVAERSAEAATFRLGSDEKTRASYPFDFRLDIRFAIEGAALSVTAELANPGDVALPASFGFHPALRWPLPWGGARADHCICFEHDEPAPIRRIGRDQLVRSTPEPTPVEGRTLVVRDALFEDDALIFDRPVSRAVTYGVPGGRMLRVSFPEMPLLGVWTKPGAGFLCIEPWQGIADPEGFAGDYRDKPGVIEVAPGGSHRFSVRIDTSG